MHVMTDAAATLGGRFNIIFDPHDRCVYQNAFGDFRERRMELRAGLRTEDGVFWGLPFASDAQVFPYLEQFSTLTTIEYRGVHPGLGLAFSMRIRAPFYPRNVGISTAPVYFVDLEVTRRKGFRWDEADSPVEKGEIVFELSGEKIGFDAMQNGFHYVFESTASSRHFENARMTRVDCWCEATEGVSAEGSRIGLPFSFSDAETARLSLTWSCWVAEPVLEVFGEATTLRYLDVFASREEMIAWALEERCRIEKRCDLVDSVVRDWSLGAAASGMCALALHSFLVDTWWTVRKDGSDWFSVWEGSCYYHSTVDVEYNGAMLYLALWPDLLGMLLDQWAEFEVDGSEPLGASGKGTSYLCHDMGAAHVVGKQAYPHCMEVEESANYILMLAAWAAFTGEKKKAGRKIPLCRRLAGFIVAADSTGDGVPDHGVANTIDDASPAVQYGRRQVYLAIKSQAALWALAELEQKCGVRDSQAERWRAFASKSIKTLDEEGWLSDHYAVTLDRSTEGLLDPWSGKELESGELEGWDAYSIYTTNGLLYLYLGGMKMPRWRTARFADDIENACRATMATYGCGHSSGAAEAVWFSQNMWRDWTAAYLGIDLLNNVERYWSYQTLTGDNWCSSLYYDTTPQNNLNFYPRGTVAFGMPLAAAGLRLNRMDKELVLSPLRSTLRVPLLPLADWERMRVPELTVRNRDGVAVARISEGDLLEGLKVSVLHAELEPE